MDRFWGKTNVLKYNAFVKIIAFYAFFLRERERETDGEKLAVICETANFFSSSVSIFEE